MNGGGEEINLFLIIFLDAVCSSLPLASQRLPPGEWCAHDWLASGCSPPSPAVSLQSSLPANTHFMTDTDTHIWLSAQFFFRVSSLELFFFFFLQHSCHYTLSAYVNTHVPFLCSPSWWPTSFPCLCGWLRRRPQSFLDLVSSQRSRFAGGTKKKNQYWCLIWESSDIHSKAPIFQMTQAHTHTQTTHNDWSFRLKLFFLFFYFFIFFIFLPPILH